MIDHDPTLPQLEHRPFLTDSGLETALIYIHGIELPEFAAFVLLESTEGRRRLRHYFESHSAIARGAGCGFIAESPTWRANPEWGERLGYDRTALDAINAAAITMLADLRDRENPEASDYVISGCIGPRGDGYDASDQMSASEAQRYHSEQIGSFANTPADLVSALTITYPDEAIGIVRAATAASIPVVISFTVETDGLLPCGVSLGEAIGEVDAATGHGPAYYMINCAHPVHFGPALEEGGPWLNRLRGIRANASRRSHAELDAADELDAGDPEELSKDYARLMVRFPQLTILGGCCGTDERHVRQIAHSCVTAAWPRNGSIRVADLRLRG